MAHRRQCSIRHPAEDGPNGLPQCGRAPDDPSYLPSKSDRACGGEPRWAAEIPVQDLERTLVAAGYRGTQLRNLEVDGRSASGRVARVALDGMTPDAISGQDLRMVVGRTLGWHLLKSTDFTVRRTGGGYRFDGKGFGHGVGLCVLGSVRRAEHGDSAREILRAVLSRPGNQPFSKRPCSTHRHLSSTQST